MIDLSRLPALREPWPSMADATFQGIATSPDGVIYALLYAGFVPKAVPHASAENIAIDHGALLPTRVDGALLQATFPVAELKHPKHQVSFWLAGRDLRDGCSPGAWAQSFADGFQWINPLKGEQTSVVLVHRIPLKNLTLPGAQP